MMIGAWPSGHPVPLEGLPSRLGFFSSADLTLTRCSPAVSAKPVCSLSHTCPDHLVRAFAAALLLPPSLWAPSARLPANPQTPGHHRQQWIVADGASLLAPGPAIDVEGSAGRRARVAHRGRHEHQLRLLANGSPSGHPWKLRCEANSKRTVRSLPQEKDQCHGAFPCRPHRHLHPAAAAMTARSAGHRQNATPAEQLWHRQPFPPGFFFLFCTYFHRSRLAAGC